MKTNMRKKSLEFMSQVVLKTAEKEANSACIFMGYQPKAPKNLKNLKKF